MGLKARNKQGINMVTPVHYCKKSCNTRTPEKEHVGRVKDHESFNIKIGRVV